MSTLRALVISAFVLVLPAVSHAADDASKTTFIHKDRPVVQPDACSIIYPSAETASYHCPPGTAVIEAYDFWKNTFLGWSCNCPKP